MICTVHMARGWVYFLFIACAARAETLAERWWEHVKFLADDRLEGRNTGLAGHREAADYVARKFEEAGLQPGAAKAWMQLVPFVTRQIDETNSSLSLNGAAITFGKEAYFEMRSDPKPETRGELVFAGHGLRAPEMNYDDLKGLDLKGKIAVVLGGAPPKWPGPIAAHLQSADIRWAGLQAAGAIGIVNIPLTQTTPWTRSAAARVQTQMTAEIGQNVGPSVSIAWNPEHAALLLDGSGHTLDELRKLARAGEALPKFGLRKTLHAKVVVKRGKLESPNVVGLLPGKRKEFVVVSGHLDHIGKTQSFAGDGIFNGAMDNASGVGALIEVARVLRGEKLNRSVLFVALTGEEKGLQGSRYFAAKPVVPAKSIAADCNMDMFMPLHEFKALTILGAEESTLGDIAKQTAERRGLRVLPDPAPEQRRFTRSDQYSFIRQGIPAIAFKFGYEKGTPEEKIHADWLRTRYHAVSDDLSQPVNIEGAGKFVEYLAALAKDVANARRRPVWKPESFFRWFAYNRRATQP
ncbi:MAG: M28 family peptidase [Acidobacteria bacterium]|nr:M28 family peptidase [Acidobacteriota bacterium]